MCSSLLEIYNAGPRRVPERRQERARTQRTGLRINSPTALHTHGSRIRPSSDRGSGDAKMAKVGFDRRGTVVSNNEEPCTEYITALDRYPVKIGTS